MTTTPSDDEGLREEILALPRPIPREADWLIEAELDDLMALIKEQVRLARVDGQIEALESLYDSVSETNTITTSHIKFVIDNCKAKRKAQLEQEEKL
jgi:hypothetical protein